MSAPSRAVMAWLGLADLEVSLGYFENKYKQTHAKKAQTLKIKSKELRGGNKKQTRWTG